MSGEILAKLAGEGWASYLEKLVLFPLETLLRLSPPLLLALYFVLRKRVQAAETEPVLFGMLAWMTLLNYLPYWLSPQSNIRYILPLCPLFALLAARIIWRAGEAAVTLSLRWLWGIVVFKFIFALALVPYYQKEFRGENYMLAAKDIMQRTQGQPLYISDSSASGLSVAGYIDALQHPQRPLQSPPAQWQLGATGYVLAYAPDVALGEIAHVYTLGGDKLYLLCRGHACAAGAAIK